MRSRGRGSAFNPIWLRTVSAFGRHQGAHRAFISTTNGCCWALVLPACGENRASLGGLDIFSVGSLGMPAYRDVKWLGLIPQALRISSPRARKNIPLKLHTSRASDGGIETIKTIIEGAAYDIDWNLPTAVTHL